MKSVRLTGSRSPGPAVTPPMSNVSPGLWEAQATVSQQVWAVTIPENFGEPARRQPVVKRSLLLTLLSNLKIQIELSGCN